MNSKKKRPIENHTTAAWSNIEKVKRITNVAVPSYMQTENAKAYVDENQK